MFIIYNSTKKLWFGAHKSNYSINILSLNQSLVIRELGVAPFIFPAALTDQDFLLAVGENVKEFFFRVASLAFETNVLAELEKSGPRQIGGVVSEYAKYPCDDEKTFSLVP